MHSKQKSLKKYHSFAPLLQEAGLRPTKQRLALAAWLFDGAPKHVTAENVHEAARRMRAGISLATIYNTLNKFTAAGLLHQVLLEGGKLYFDTNVELHHHILDESDGSLTDIPASSVRIAQLPNLPRGKSLSRVDVILRVHSDT